MSFEQIIYGTGGFGREVMLYWLNQYPKINAVFAVDDVYYKEPEIMGKKVYKGSDIRCSRRFDSPVIIAIADIKTRKNIVEYIPNAIFSSLKHRLAFIAYDARIGDGAIITPYVTITQNVVIGDHCQLNLKTSIGHDCRIGDYFTTAPGVSISGNCNIGNNVYFGSNSAVREKVNICDNVIIGMGAMVLKDITEPGTYVGNPLRKIK